MVELGSGNVVGVVVGMGLGGVVYMSSGLEGWGVAGGYGWWWKNWVGGACDGGLSVGAWRLLGGCSELKLVALGVLALCGDCMECEDGDMGGKPWTWTSRVNSPGCGRGGSGPRLRVVTCEKV